MNGLAPLFFWFGVGLLMTIAAIGAVLLGHVGEAATLAFLFSKSKNEAHKHLKET